MEFQKSLDAALSSWFENDIFSTDIAGADVKELAFHSLEQHCLSHGKPLAAGDVTELLEIDSEGFLNARLPGSREITITESDDLLWPDQSS